MKAVLIHRDQGNRLEFSEVPDPQMKSGEVLVQVDYAGVNRADLMQRAGKYPPPPGAPDYMGLEISGHILELSAEAKDKTAFRAGDKVCCLLPGGGYAEKVSVPWEMLMKVPSGIDLALAAALPEAFATSYLNLFLEGSMKEKDCVLITGGNSGLASVMIPMAKAFGAYVITTVRNRQKADRVLGLGPDRIVDTSVQSLEEALSEEQKAGHPVDLAVDCVGGPDVGGCLKYMSYGGKWIQISSLAGECTQVNLRTVFTKNVRLIGSTLRSRPLPVKKQILDSLQKEIWPFVETGKIVPVVREILPIQSVELAHRLLAEGKADGKIVLQVHGV